jgi:hypothetical protein
MIQILPKVKSPGEKFGEALGGGLGQGFSEGMEERRKKNLQGKENAALKDKYGIDVEGVLDPTTRSQIIGEELRRGRILKEGKAASEIDTSLTGNQAGKRKIESEISPRGENNLEMQDKAIVQPKQSQKTIPSKQTILTPDQLQQRTKEVFQQYNEKGIPTTIDQVYADLYSKNEQNKGHNQHIESEQNKYGDLAHQILTEKIQNPSESIIGLMRKKGEELAFSGSEADIRSEIGKEVVNLKNAISKAEKTIKSKNVFGASKRDILGSSRSAEQELNSYKAAVKPLLDKGLYDEARAAITSNSDLMPEEVETIVSNLGEPSKKIVGQMDKMKPSIKQRQLQPYGYVDKQTYSPEQQEKIQQNVNDVLKNEPSVNLILLRKAFEDKGIEWDAFKEAIDNAYLSGDVKMTPDQENQMETLDSPPLNRLEKILHGFRLIGR